MMRCLTVFCFLVAGLLAPATSLWAADSPSSEDYRDAQTTQAAASADHGHAPGEGHEDGAFALEAPSLGHGDHYVGPLPPKLEDYQAQEAELGITSLWGKIRHRATTDPFSLVATLIFFCAIAHTFFAGSFRNLAHKIEHSHHERLAKELAKEGKRLEDLDEDSKVSFRAEVCHFFGEVEAIFGIWLLPLFFVITLFHGYHAVPAFVDLTTPKYVEPIFVVVIMAIASTRAVLKFAEQVLSIGAKLGGSTPSAWWIVILTVAPLLGSFITEPAAMTIAALLLAKKFYVLKPSAKLQYGTLGLLFVNVSVGGTLTHFAAPPVLMVAKAWGFDMIFMLTHFGWKAVVGIAVATTVYFFVFRKELGELDARAAAEQSGDTEPDPPVPAWITVVVLGFMAWTVFNLHHPALFVGGFLFFLAFAQATANHQDDISIKSPLLVGFFLAGLVTHGSLQQWWIAPVLSALGELPLFIGATVLTAFNDNAAITFLASQVPAFDAFTSPTPDVARALEYAVVAGAVTGGGLTVIANAPNPAGQSILSRFFKNGVSPLNLALGAMIPTFILALAFLLLP